MARIQNIACRTSNTDELQAHQAARVPCSKANEHWVGWLA
jgi:hypothetical protein